MDNLSAELDNNIIHFLKGDRTTLGALNQTSKYYHAITQPLLYERIALKPSKSQMITSLLLTLLDRPECAQYIKSIKLQKGHIAKQKRDPDLSLRMKTEAMTILPPKLANPWYKMGFDASGETPRFDGVLALILSMATNLESFTLQWSWRCYLPITVQLYTSSVSRAMELTNEEVGPFQKLKHLKIHMPRSQLTYRPNPFTFLTLESLTLTNVCTYGLPYHTAALPNAPLLRKLVLKNCHCLSLFSTTLPGYFPNLEEFEWTQATDDRENCHHVFDFKRCTKLKLLRVDLAVFRRWGLKYILKAPHEFFPEALEYLEIQDIRARALTETVATFQDDESQGEVVKQSLKRYHETSALKVLRLKLRSGDLPSLNPSILLLLGSTADELAKIGLKFQVFSDQWSLQKGSSGRYCGAHDDSAVASDGQANV